MILRRRREYGPGLWKKCIDIISFISNFCIMLPLQFYTEVTYGFPLLGSCYVLLLYLYLYFSRVFLSISSSILTGP